MGPVLVSGKAGGGLHVRAGGGAHGHAQLCGHVCGVEVGEGGPLVVDCVQAGGGGHLFPEHFRVQGQAGGRLYGQAGGRCPCSCS